MKRKFVLYTCLFFVASLAGQDKLLTVAESSGFKSTSTHKDVMNFVNELKSFHEIVSVEELAVSEEGRSIPLIIIANPLPSDPSEFHKDNRVYVYIQANIHAGEVEGKEASLMLARDLVSGKYPEILKNVIFLICPNFNPDGNERISTLNRPYQAGPENGVGVRHNAAMLDLNRDAMKAESAEVRGLIRNVFNKWDPHVFVDCHTTNGSYHVEPVTFTWMVNPNGDRKLIDYMSDKMMPVVSSTLLTKYGVENCYYGEFADMLNPEKGWFFDVPEPRYMTNYYGLRNRLAILNENYVYADYRSRVFGCYNLLLSIAEYASNNREEIRKLIVDTDAGTIKKGADISLSDSFAVEYAVRPLKDPVTIKTYEAEVVTNESGRRSLVKTDRRRDVTIPYYIDYYPVRSVKLPYAYLITPSDREVVEKLRLHGIATQILAKDFECNAEQFVIKELTPSARLNQGHYTNNIKGEYAIKNVSFPAGTMVVMMSQPLSGLAAYLLEPESNDGLLVWNYFDKYLVPQWGGGFYPYPVYKIYEKINLPLKPL